MVKNLTDVAQVTGGAVISGPGQWFKDLVLMQLWLGSQLWILSDPWPRNSMCCGAAKNERKRKKKHRLM